MLAMSAYLATLIAAVVLVHVSAPAVLVVACLAGALVLLVRHEAHELVRRR